MSVISYHNPNEDYDQRKSRNNYRSKGWVVLSVIIILLTISGVTRICVKKYTEPKADDRDIASPINAAVLGEENEESTDAASEGSSKSEYNKSERTEAVSFLDSETINENGNDSALQFKTKILSKAKSKADVGDYAGAITIIKSVQSDAADDSDYISTIDTYKKKYKDSVLSSSDKLSEKGEYLQAISKAKETTDVLGSDTEVDNKVKEYEAMYAASVVNKAEKLIAERDYDGAETAVSEGLKNVPGNSKLNSEAQKIAVSRPISNDMIMTKLDENHISDSGGYKVYLKKDTTINVFAEDVMNAFSLNCLASYNLWTAGIQTVDFRVDELNIDTLCFTICGETGTSGAMTVEIFIDRPIDESTPDYKYELKDAPYPVEAEVNISGARTMAIRAKNHDDPNTIVFYNFRGQ